MTSLGYVYIIENKKKKENFGNMKLSHSRGISKSKDFRHKKAQAYLPGQKLLFEFIT